MFSVMVSAHPGHIAENTVAHALEHFSWYIAGTLILFCLVRAVRPYFKRLQK
jgi:hypothetical protein